MPWRSKWPRASRRTSTPCSKRPGPRRSRRRSCGSSTSPQATGGTHMKRLLIAAVARPALAVAGSASRPGHQDREGHQGLRGPEMRDVSFDRRQRQRQGTARRARQQVQGGGAPAVDDRPGRDDRQAQSRAQAVDAGEVLDDTQGGPGRASSRTWPRSRRNRPASRRFRPADIQGVRDDANDETENGC
jgi:hypothetical protein